MAWRKYNTKHRNSEQKALFVLLFSKNSSITHTLVEKIDGYHVIDTYIDIVSLFQTYQTIQFNLYIQNLIKHCHKSNFLIYYLSDRLDWRISKCALGPSTEIHFELTQIPPKIKGS